MEDAHLATKLNILGKEFKIFGIFDGHGGANASIFVKSNLTKYLSHYLKEEFVNTKNLDIAIYNAFKSAFYRLDYDYKDFDGTTATVAVIVDNTVYTANAGDSRTLIIDGQNILQLSEDAKPDISKFSKRIHKRGGYITPDQITNHYGQKIHEIPRVNGCLAVASSIGDKKIKGFGNLCCVPARPKITKYQPKQKNFQLVLACDGLFDVATTNTVGQNIQDLFKRNQSVENIAEKIVNAAYTAGSSDNISTMVVKNYS